MDRVQVMKQEWSGLGGDAADELPWPAPIEPQEDAPEVAGVYFQDASNRDENVLIDRNGNALRLKDVDNPAPIELSDFVTVAKHKAIRQLIHFIDNGPAEGFASGAYKEKLPTGDVFPTSVIWWESSSKLKKIVEKTITRSGGSATNVFPTPIVWKIYDTDGSTVLATITDTVVYSGAMDSTVTRTIA